MTFSIAARCTRTGMFGVAIASSSPAVAARCAHARAGVGAACTQNITDPRLGPRLLDLLASGATAEEAIEIIAAETEAIAYRQLSVIDNQGRAASYSGTHTLGIHQTAAGVQAVAAGNLLDNEDVPRAMVDAFPELHGHHLGDRLIRALTAGLEAGGEKSPVHSAGMIVVDTVPWPITDLRVDWSKDPVGDLAKLWRVWRPQMDAYVERALRPGDAPSYGVPGEDG